MITIKNKQLLYDMNPIYGKVFDFETNETFFGNISVKMFKNISAFQFTFELKSTEGKVVMTKTIKPCEQKRDKRLDVLVTSMFEAKKTDDYELLKPFIWSCPIVEVNNTKLSTIDL